MTSLGKSKLGLIVRTVLSGSGLTWLLAPHLVSGWRPIVVGAGVAAVEYVAHAIWPQEPQRWVNGVIAKAAKAIAGKATPPTP